MPRHCSKRADLRLRGLASVACALLLSALLCACLPADASADEPAADGPYGTQPQITEDGRLFAWLYLPGLPGHPELEVLRIERARADAPDEWEPIYTFAWDEDWQEYAALEDPFQTVRYYNYDTGDDTPYVDYFEAEGPHRSFYLRARADVVVDGTEETLSFESVLFRVPGDEGAGDEEGESGGAADGGGSGGDKGGIGQGENERPDIEPPALTPSVEAVEDEGDAENVAGAGAYVAPRALERAESAEATTAQEEPPPAEAPASEEQALVEPATEDSSEQEPMEDGAPARLPGAVVALGATAALAAALAAIALLRRGRESGPSRL